MLEIAGLVVAASLVVGQAEGEETFKSFSELMLGGTWGTTDSEGRTVKHTYRKLPESKFIQITMDGGEFPGFGVLGVDPDTGELTWWSFFADGRVGKVTIKEEKKGTWVFEARDDASGGDTHIKWRVSKLDGDTLRDQALKVRSAGEDQDLWDNTWKRSKAK